MMKTYSVRTADPTAGPPTIHLDTDSLTVAVEACLKLGRRAYVLHVDSDLQRAVIGDRVCWIDDHGREHDAPGAR